MYVLLNDYHTKNPSDSPLSSYIALLSFVLVNCACAHYPCT